MLQPFNISTSNWNRRPSESIWSDSTPSEWRRHLYDLSHRAHSQFFDHSHEFGLGGINQNQPLGFPLGQPTFLPLGPDQQFMQQQQQQQHQPHQQQHHQQKPDMKPPSRRRTLLGSDKLVAGEEMDPKELSCFIAEYFGTDPHERVAVTLEYVESVLQRELQYLSDAHQLPKFPIEKQMYSHNLCIVEFKAGRVDVFHLPKEGRPVSVGDLVIVEADRGKDLGRIAQIHLHVDTCRIIKLFHLQDQLRALTEDPEPLTLKNYHSMQHAGGSSQSLHFPKPVLGLAQHADILSLVQKKQDEDKACRLCLTKIAAVTSGSTTLDLLQMKLVDAEYQFDRKKLTFYYSTCKRIDFRDLVRELFRIYKTRIWMCAVVGLPYKEKRPTASPTNLSSSPIMQSPQFSFGNYKISNDMAMMGQAPTKMAYRRMSLDEGDPLQRINEMLQMPFTPSNRQRHASAPVHPNDNYFTLQENPLWQTLQMTEHMDDFMLKSLVDSINH